MDKVKDILYDMRCDSFLEALTKLTKEHGLCIKQDGESGQPFLTETTIDDDNSKYRLDSDGVLWF